VLLFVQGRVSLLVILVAMVGLFLSDLDQILITLILAQPTSDVDGFWHTLQIRHIHANDSDTPFRCLGTSTPYRDPGGPHLNDEIPEPEPATILQ
jgi:hypothetical protein